MVKGSGGNSNRFRNLHLDIRVLSLHYYTSAAPAEGAKQSVSVEMTHVWTVIVVASGGKYSLVKPSVAERLRRKKRR